MDDLAVPLFDDLVKQYEHDINCTLVYGIHLSEINQPQHLRACICMAIQEVLAHRKSMGSERKMNSFFSEIRENLTNAHSDPILHIEVNGTNSVFDDNLLIELIDKMP